MIKIHSRGELHALVHKSPGELDCVVLYEPEHPAWPNDRRVDEILSQCRNHIAVAFHDITTPRQGYVEPQEKHISDIIEWSKNYPEIHVACRAGISRSSAVAYLIACDRMSPEKAVEILNPEWHMPNELILRIGNKLLEKNNILPAINEYLEKAAGVWHV